MNPGVIHVFVLRTILIFLTLFLLIFRLTGRGWFACRSMTPELGPRELKNNVVTEQSRSVAVGHL